MADEFIVYRTFPDMADAEQVAELLLVQGIQSEVATGTHMLDAAIGGTYYDNNFVLRLKAEDFPTANRILQDYAQAHTDDVDPDHPLRSMDNDELLKVIARPDEWGPDNFSVARKLLAERGVEVSDTRVSDMEQDRIAELSERKTLDPMVFMAGNAFAVSNIILIVTKQQFFIALHKGIWFIPGFLGIFWALFILQARNTLPDGKRIPVYDNKVLKNALVMLGFNALAWIINILCLMFWL